MSGWDQTPGLPNHWAFLGHGLFLNSSDLGNMLEMAAVVPNGFSTTSNKTKTFLFQKCIKIVKTILLLLFVLVFEMGRSRCVAQADLKQPSFCLHLPKHWGNRREPSLLASNIFSSFGRRFHLSLECKLRKGRDFVCLFTTIFLTL